jgi:hypothetical protein
MSHYIDIVTEIRDQDALLQALGRLGFGTGKVEVYKDPTNLYGYQGDKRSQLAHVIIRRRFVGAASNDIGFLRQDDGRFVSHISEYDQSRYNTTWQNKLSTYYGVEKSKIELSKKGLSFAEDLDEQQRPRIRVRL